MIWTVYSICINAWNYIAIVVIFNFKLGQAKRMTKNRQKTATIIIIITRKQPRLKLISSSSLTHLIYGFLIFQNLSRKI